MILPTFAPEIFGETLIPFADRYDDIARPLAIQSLIDAGRLADDSWHNDACPSVCVPDVRTLPVDSSRDGYYPKLWVDAIDPDNRESGAEGRYMVTGGDADSEGHETVLFEGDDVSRALTVLFEATARHMAAFGRKH